MRPLLFVLLFLSSLAVANDKGPIIPKGKGDACVADTDFMRRNHMDLIVHQRDETVIKGIRDEPFSLVECVDCHVQKNANNEFIRIDAQDQFCASCHTFVAAKIDCFSCHAAVPDAMPDTNAREKLGSSDWLPVVPSLMLAVQNKMLTGHVGLEAEQLTDTEQLSDINVDRELGRSKQ